MPPAITSPDPPEALEEVDALEDSVLPPASRSTFSCLTLGMGIVAGSCRFFDGHLRIHEPSDFCLRTAAVGRLTAVLPFAIASAVVRVPRSSACTAGVLAADCSGVSLW